jgi:uncharacterized protein (TIGR03435 family)
MLKACLLVAVGVVAVLGGGLMAQTPPAGPPQTAGPARPAFEVASLRLDDSPFVNDSPLGQNRWTATQAGLVRLLMLAFDVPFSQMVGVPVWSRSERYAVAAKAEDGVRLTRETLALCLQRFLAERFKLVTHRETQQRKGYALVVAKSGPKMKAAKDGPPMMSSFDPRGSLRARSVEMDTFAQTLGQAILGGALGGGQMVAVVNETGLAGTYEFTLTFAPEGSTDSSLPSVFTALEEQLGLKLESRTVPVEMLIIDHVERPVLD